MSSGLRHRLVDLLPQQMLRLRGHAGTRLMCRSGTLWITQEGVLRDDFLSAGEALCVESTGLILAQATGRGPARLGLREAPGASSFTLFPGKAGI
jgi:DUF2917 family protein